MDNGIITQSPSYRPSKPRGRYKRVSKAKKVFSAVLLAILVFAAILGGMYFTGWRFIKKKMWLHFP